MDQVLLDKKLEKQFNIRLAFLKYVGRDNRGYKVYYHPMTNNYYKYIDTYRNKTVNKWFISQGINNYYNHDTPWELFEYRQRQRNDGKQRYYNPYSGEKLTYDIFEHKWQKKVDCCDCRIV